MKQARNIFLLVVALVLFAFVACLGIVYSSVYYLFKEKDKGYSYTYRCAVMIDILGNVMFGELFELFFAEVRHVGYFGAKTTISAAIGHLIATKNITNFGLRFSGWLDVAFREKDHCLEAYKKEILK
jgi:hypothetical protein